MISWRTTAGGSEEFERVALVHLDALYHTALRLTRNRAEAEDCVQEACLRAFRGFHRFNPGTNMRAWLFTILRNVFLNRIRRERHEVRADDTTLESESRSATLEAPAGDSPEEEFYQTVLHGDVERALHALPLAFREVVILADLEGLTYREIADAMGCPIGTVMSRLSRGRRLLRESLGRFAREHGYLAGHA